MRDLFSDKYGNLPDPQNLGVGYVIDNDTPYSFYLESPCIWYEIHAKDLNGIIPPEHLVIKRWVVDTAWASWNSDGDMDVDHSNWLIGANKFDSNDYSFLFDIGVNNDSVNLDPSRIMARIFSDHYN